jgi:hypothetical protein
MVEKADEFEVLASGQQGIDGGVLARQADYRSDGRGVAAHVVAGH